MKSPSRSVGSALARTSCHHRCRSHFAVMIGLLAACTGQPPAVCPDWEPAQLEVVTGNEVVSGTCFTDPEGETLTITGVSSDEEVVTVRVIGTYYQVRALSPGVATITLRAEDPAGGAASVSVPVLVPNRPPIALGDIPRARMLIGGSSRSVIARYFGDPDGQPLTFSAASGDPDVVSAAIEDSTRLIVRGLTLGEATVTVWATDPGGLGATQTATVTVTAVNEGPEVVEAIPNQTLVEALCRAGLRMEADAAPVPAGGPLSGLTFCFTGAMASMTRSQAAERVKALGAAATDSVTRKTTYLVAGADPGASKLRQAERAGTQSLTEEQFLALLESPEAVAAQ